MNIIEARKRLTDKITNENKYLNFKGNMPYIIQEIKDDNNAIKIILKENELLDKIKEYVEMHIELLTKTICDYIDDDKEGNKHIIGELKESRENWKDIIRIINGQEVNFKIL